MNTKTIYLVNGARYETLPSYLEKDGLMRPVIPEWFTIETVEETIDDSELVSRFKQLLYAEIAALNAAYVGTNLQADGVTPYAALTLTIDDTPSTALAKLQEAGVTKGEVVYLDTLYRNLNEAQS